MSTKVSPTNTEQTFGIDELIVSKTDVHGKITYANDVFMRVAGYDEAELLGAPHSIIRHPDMPRCVFQLLWDTLEAGQEIFAFVKNLCKNGDYYWVFAHVTPSMNENDSLVGYHSSRRVPDLAQVQKVEPIYRALLAEEAKHSNKAVAITASTAILTKTLQDASVSYHEFIFSL